MNFDKIAEAVAAIKRGLGKRIDLEMEDATVSVYTLSPTNERIRIDVNYKQQWPELAK